MIGAAGPLLILEAAAAYPIARLPCGCPTRLQLNRIRPELHIICAAGGAGNGFMVQGVDGGEHLVAVAIAALDVTAPMGGSRPSADLGIGVGPHPAIAS